MTVRLYYEKEGTWSIDNGPGTEVTTVEWVNVAWTYGQTRVNLSADNVSEPRAWIEFQNVQIELTGNGVVISK